MWWGGHPHLEGLDQLERGEDGRAVLKALVEHRAEPALELLDLAAEGVEVVVEPLHVDVEHVVRQAQHSAEQAVEVGVDLHDRRRDRVAREGYERLREGYKHPPGGA